MNHTTDRPIRILLVDDQPLFRAAVASLIEAQDDMEVIGQAENGLGAVEKAHTLVPDIVLMDVEMPVMNGVEATRLIREQLPEIKVVLLTVSDSDQHVLDAVHFGVSGYLLKDLRPEQLYEMLRCVVRGETPLSAAVAGRLFAEIRDQGLVRTPAPDTPALSKRELAVLQLVAEGMSNKEIASSLFITEGTVKNHVHNALDKLKLGNRAQAAAYIVRNGMGRVHHES